MIPARHRAAIGIGAAVALLAAAVSVSRCTDERAHDRLEREIEERQEVLDREVQIIERERIRVVTRIRTIEREAQADVEAAGDDYGAAVRAWRDGIGRLREAGRSDPHDPPVD